MQQHAFEGLCPNTVYILLSIYVAFMYHKSSFHLMLTPHNKCYAEISKLTAAGQFPWCCIALCMRISLDIEATQLKIARQVSVAQPSSATQLRCFWYHPPPCRSSPGDSVLCLPVLHFSRSPYFVFEEVFTVTLSSVTVMSNVVKKQPTNQTPQTFRRESENIAFWPRTILSMQAQWNVCSGDFSVLFLSKVLYISAQKSLFASNLHCKLQCKHGHDLYKR